MPDVFGIDLHRPEFTLTMSYVEADAIRDGMRVLAYMRDGDAEAVAMYLATSAVAGPPAEQCDALAERVEALTAETRRELHRRIQAAADEFRRSIEEDV